MTRRVLLDAVAIIAAFDTAGDTSEEIRRTATARIEAVLTDRSARLYITPLIRYEVLRGVPHDDPRRLERLRAALAGFETLDVTDPVADLASDLFRLDRHGRAGTGVHTVDKRRFDAFHFAEAKVSGPEFESLDEGMSSLEALHLRLLTERGS